MENEMNKGEASKAPSLPEQSSGPSSFASEQWIIRALNDLKGEIQELRNDFKAIGNRVRSLEGWVKGVGGFLSAIMFLILLILFLSRLGLDISITMTPEETRTPSSTNAPIQQK